MFRIPFSFRCKVIANLVFTVYKTVYCWQREDRIGSLSVYTTSKNITKYTSITEIIAEALISEARVHFTILGAPFSPKNFKWAREAAAGKIKINAKIFIFIDFSLGRNEDKIINTIKIPPVNRSVKISGNQDVPVLIARKAIRRSLRLNKLTANFIGPREEMVAVTEPVTATRRQVIILSSLLRILTLEVKGARESCVSFLCILFR